MNLTMRFLQNEEECQKAREDYFWVMTYVYTFFRENYVVDNGRREEVQEVLNNVTYDYCVKNPGFGEKSEEDLKAEVYAFAKERFEKWINRQMDNPEQEMEDGSDWGVVLEFCPNCENDVSFLWNFNSFGKVAYCPICGARLPLCSYCEEDCELEEYESCQKAENKYDYEKEMREIASCVVRQIPCVMKEYPTHITSRKTGDSIVIHAQRNKNIIKVILCSCSNRSGYKWPLIAFNIAYDQEKIGHAENIVYRKLLQTIDANFCEKN